MSYYLDKTNSFFYEAYRHIFNFACTPARRSIELVVPYKRIADFNGQEMASAALMGIFVAFPLSCITFPLAIKAAIYTYILHAIAAVFSVLLDTATHLSHSMGWR